MLKAQILLNNTLINVKKQKALYKKRSKQVNELLTINYNWKQTMKAEKIILEIENAILKIRSSEYGIPLEEGKKLQPHEFGYDQFQNQEMIITGMQQAIRIIKDHSLIKVIL